ncbi:hypothetical protein A4D02_07765 [Niastella koreensis]|uniref:Uncharacterized protein n=2 Tax=Niastella koreensis TaxID=354356 RepID=G8TL51_NIAKG|nr:hypothetical protein [Niastella koreensis]AEW01892.1 hypothetical protein Niako_5660 [Niastella koreensis GR20-10]OQP48596.1 hypothetical protein A4D02_07765 [Niastella koreensis]
MVILIFAICSLYYGGWGGLLLVMLAVIFGFLLSSPLLVVISPLIKFSSRIPYASRSKMAWLIFSLFIIYSLILTGLRLILGDNYDGVVTKEDALLMLSTIVVQFLAVRTTRKSLYKLYEQL